MEKHGFIIGEWYKDTSSGFKNPYYIRILDVEEEIRPTGNWRKIYYSEKIQGKKYKTIHPEESNYWANSEMETSALENSIVDISEIQEFLPEYHIDLLKINKQSYEYLIPFLKKYNII